MGKARSPALWSCLALLCVVSMGVMAAQAGAGGTITVCPPPGTGCAYTTIAQAIAHAGPGGAILVAQGLYTENLSIDRPVSLQGGYAGPPAWERDVARYETIVDGSGHVSRTVRSGAAAPWGYPVIAFVGGSSGSTVDGLTLRGGSADFGGGIFVEDAQVVVHRCTLYANHASTAGGAISVNRGQAVIDACTVVSNTVSYLGGGGIHIGWNAVVTVTNNVIAFNSGPDLTGDGMLILGAMTQAHVANNTIASNAAEGIQADYYSTALARNNILAGNGGGLVNVYGQATLTSDHNLFWETGQPYASVSPGPGDLVADPAFECVAARDFRLRAGSPAIDAGTPDGAPATDLEGRPRDALPDLGAYERVVFRRYLPVVVKQ